MVRTYKWKDKWLRKRQTIRGWGIGTNIYNKAWYGSDWRLYRNKEAEAMRKINRGIYDTELPIRSKLNWPLYW